MPYVPFSFSLPTKLTYSDQRSSPDSSGWTAHADGNLIVYKTTRTGTDRNAQLRKLRKALWKRGYKLLKKDVYTGQKERYWDASKKKWRWRKIISQAWRLAEYKRKVKIPTTGLIPNDLNFTEECFNIRDSDSLYNAYIQGIIHEYPATYNRFAVIQGSFLGNIPSVNLQRPVHYWDSTSYWYPYPPGLLDPNFFTPSGMLSSGNGCGQNISATIADLEAKCSNAIMDQAKNQIVNIQNDIAEGRQTITMIGDAAKRIARTLLALRHGRILEATKELFPCNRKALANDYLIYRYGVKPLIEDIHGALEHLASRDVSRPIRIKVKRSKKFDPVDRVVENSGQNPPNPVNTIRFRDGKITCKTTVTVKAVLEFTVDDPAQQELTSLGFTNPLATAWELVPFSFIADWFLPVGNALNRLDSFSGITLGNYYVTTVVKQSIEYNGILGSSHDGSGASRGYGEWVPKPVRWTKDIISVKRTKKSCPITPTFPRLKNPLSKIHILNALALFQQLR